MDQRGYIDAAILHAVLLRRFMQGEVDGLLRRLEESDARLALTLRAHLPGLLGRPFAPADPKLRRLLDAVTEERRDTIRGLRTTLKDDLAALAKLEVAAETGLMTQAFPEEETRRVPYEALVALLALPFSVSARSAKTLDQWFTSLLTSDRAAVVSTVQLSIVTGASVDQAMGHLVGTRANRFADGAIAATRRNLQTITQTAVNHTSNAARGAVWLANDSVIGTMWVATLDNRTSDICRYRHGRAVAFFGHALPPGTPRLDPPGARPPAHARCRSIMVALFRNAGIPTAPTYSDWLGRQTSTTQNQILGLVHAQAFRAGTRVEGFADRRGNGLSLDQLARERSLL